MCEPTSLPMTSWVSKPLRMLSLKSSQLRPWAVTAFSRSSMLSSLFWMRIWSSFLITPGSTLVPRSLARWTRRDWSIRSRNAFLRRSSVSLASCSAVQRFWQSALASSSAVVRARSYSDLVMISLLTRAMISSTVRPTLGSSTGFTLGLAAGFGTAGLAASGSGCAVPGASREGC